MAHHQSNGKPGSQRATWIAAAVLIAAVAATGGYLWWALSDWGLGGLGLHGILALILGGLGTLALAGGLMFLVFWSARSGHDDLAHDDRSHEPRRRDDGDDTRPPGAGP